MNAAADFSRVAPGDPGDGGVFDHDVIGAAEVDAKQRPRDSAIAHADTRGSHMDPGSVAPEFAGAAAVDVESLDRHAGRAHANDAAVTRSLKQRPSHTHERDRAIDEQVAVVAPRRHDYA